MEPNFVLELVSRVQEGRALDGTVSTEHHSKAQRDTVEDQSAHMRG